MDLYMEQNIQIKKIYLFMNDNKRLNKFLNLNIFLIYVYNND